MAIKRVSDLTKYDLTSQDNKLNLNDLIEIEVYDKASDPAAPQYVSKKLTYGELLSSLLKEFGESMSNTASALDQGPAISPDDPLVTYKKLPSPFPLGTLFHTTIPYDLVRNQIVQSVDISVTLDDGNIATFSNCLSSTGSYLPADGGVICSLSTFQTYITKPDVSAYVSGSYIMDNYEFDSLYAQLSDDQCDSENSIMYTISAYPYDINRRIRDVYRPITGYVYNRFYGYWHNYRWGYGYGYGYPYGYGYNYGYGYPYGQPWYRTYYNSYWWLWYHRPWARRLPQWHPMRRIYENRLSSGQELYSQSMIYKSKPTTENPFSDAALLSVGQAPDLNGFQGAPPERLVYLPTLKNIYVENTDEVSADHTFDVPTLPNITGRFHAMSNCGVAEGVFKSNLAHGERYHAICNTVGVGDYTFDASRNSSTYDLSNLGEVKPFSLKLIPYVLVKTQPVDYVVTKINFAKMNPFAK